MERRNFIQQSFLAGAGVITTRLSSTDNKKNRTADKPFNLDYAIHDGMFKNSAGNNFIDQIQFAYDKGFRAIEDNGFMDRPIAEQEKIGNILSKLNMRMGVFVLNFDHWPVKTSLTSGDKEWREKFCLFRIRFIHLNNPLQVQLLRKICCVINIVRKIPTGA